MKILIFHTNYKKKFKKLRKSEKVRVNNSLYLLETDHFNPILNNHPLHGLLKGYRSVDAGGDLMIVYKEIQTDTFLVADLGIHHQLYGK